MCHGKLFLQCRNFNNRPPMGGNIMQSSRSSIGSFGSNNSRPLNGGNPPFERNGWGNSNSNQYSSPPPNMMASNINSPPPSNSLGLGNQNGPGNASSGGKTTTQVTIPKEVSRFYFTFWMFIFFTFTCYLTSVVQIIS